MILVRGMLDGDLCLVLTIVVPFVNLTKAGAWVKYSFSLLLHYC